MTRNIKALISFWLATGCCASAGAQTLKLEQICIADQSGQRVFSPNALMMAVLDSAQISRRTIDANADGTETELERISVVLLNPCASGPLCTAENGKVVTAQTLLFETFSRTDLDIARKRPQASREEREKEPWLDIRPAGGAIGSIAELVDPKQRFLKVTCTNSGATSVAADTSTNTGARPPSPSPKAAVRITSKLEELTREPDQDLKTIDPATLSIANDSVGQKLTFDIDGIFGVAIPVGESDEQLIPFVQYQRTSIRDRSVTPATTERSPDKIGLGVVVRVRLAKHDPVDIAPIYVIDYEKHSRVLGLKANWVPGILREIDALPIMRSRPLIGDYIYYGLSPRILGQFSHVADAGTNPDLLQTSDYLRGGGEITLDLWGAEALANFTASVSYKRLFRLTSGPGGVHLFKTNIQYWLDSSQHVSVGYTYEEGLDEDTIDRVKNWKLSLGLRF